MTIILLYHYGRMTAAIADTYMHVYDNNIQLYSKSCILTITTITISRFIKNSSLIIQLHVYTTN